MPCHGRLNKRADWRLVLKCGDEADANLAMLLLEIEPPLMVQSFGYYTHDY
jgi:hypothetical protein